MASSQWINRCWRCRSLSCGLEQVSSNQPPQGPTQAPVGAWTEIAEQGNLHAREIRLWDESLERHDEAMVEASMGVKPDRR